ncbi:MAG: UDP-N-acetylmuramoyl-tripeptide--D-alanyl-D-alanine ligase [Rhodoferax sp.]|nr:UDP-N-acetylmuramoyl-tripeptide--D-alanyl-D-alanine ligase [Rhodoferax sp.]
MMTLAQAVPWLAESRLTGDGAVAFSRVHTDSRTLQSGDLFVALRGERFDGNDFLAEARAKGAVAALCQGDAQARLEAAGLPGVLVPDAKLALAQLATAWRAQFKLPLIAVTGSNGKTTVTQMIAAILQAFQPGASLATQGNFNNDIGVPLTLLRLRAEHQLAVVELGMNHPGEIATLAAIAQPTVALVNNAQREHMEFMATVEAVAHENGSVIDALPGNGVAVYPCDDAFTPVWLAKAAQRATLCFALDAAPGATDVFCTSAVWAGEHWQVAAQTPVGALSYSLHIAGQHNVKNSLAAACCALAAGVPRAAIEAGLAAFEPVQGRSRAVSLERDGHRLTVVDDTYNANPDSVRAAMAVLASLPGPHLLVLGDMGEVGDQGPQFHAQAGREAGALGIEMLMTLGEASAAASGAFPGGRHFGEVQGLNAAVRAALPQLGSVLVKGSRFMKMERVVQAIGAACPSEKEKIHAA